MFSIASILFFLLMSLTHCSHEQTQEVSQNKTRFPEPLKAKKIILSSIPVYHEVVGTIQAKASTVLSSNISGNIKHISVVEGKSVKTGELLIEIDDRDITAKMKQAQAAYENSRSSLNEVKTGINQAHVQKKQAEANLKLSESTYTRYEKLYQDKAISDQEFDTVKAQYSVGKTQVQSAEEGIAQALSKKAQFESMIDQAKSALEEANVMLSYTRILAPFDGIIVKKNVEVGSLAVPGIPLLTIENPTGFRLEVDVSEAEFAGKVSIGCPVDVKIDALGDQIIQGHVAEIVPSANPMSRTFRIKIALTQVQGLQSGMYGKALCSKGEREVILIPKQALIKRGQLEQVMTVEKTAEDHIVHLRLIKTGKTFKDQIEVVSGLSPETLVIVDPKPGLKDGNTIQVEVL